MFPQLPVPSHLYLAAPLNVHVNEYECERRRIFNQNILLERTNYITRIVTCHVTSKLVFDTACRKISSLMLFIKMAFSFHCHLFIYIPYLIYVKQFTRKRRLCPCKTDVLCLHLCEWVLVFVWGGTQQNGNSLIFKV